MNSQETHQRQVLLILDERHGRARTRPRTRGFLFTALLSLVMFLALPCAALAQAALTDDADSQNGHTPNLNLSSGSNVYLKFKLSSTLPSSTAGSDVAKATVKLYLGAVKSPGSLDVYLLGSNWSEKTVASAPPALGTPLQTGIPVQSDQKEKFLVIDVTQAVRQWLGEDGSGAGGAPNYGVALVARAGADVAFDSKENSQTSHEPQLNVQLKSAAGQPGPAGPQGPQGAQGVAGPQGPKGLNWQGAWDAAANYVADDAVSYQGSSWRAKRANTNVTPVEGDDWTIIAQKGDDVSGGTVTEVSGSGPVIVTNPTTTPNISLGVVPAAHGGTGLTSAGAAGSFLRSDGGAWTSGPLTAADIPDLGGSYIRNATALQSSSNFNIGGTGAANVFDAATHYNLGGSRILGAAGTNNLFAGTDAGASNTTGAANAFFGKNAGRANTTGSSNSFAGYNAGAGNTTGGQNSFFGDAAGFRNAAGSNNSFFGFLAGFHNTASDNSYFGSLAGADNTTGSQNSFFGSSAGVHNTTGVANSFFGKGAGAHNTAGNSNSFFGREAGLSNTTGSSNSFFGNTAGALNTTGEANTFFGGGAGAFNTTGGGNSFVGQGAGQNNTTGSDNVFFGRLAGLSNDTGSNLTLVGANANVGANNLSYATAVGAEAVVSTSNTVVLGRSADTVQVPGALNVAGTFGANVLDAATQFNLGGNRVLSNTGLYNLFAGVNAGANNVGVANSFFGHNAGAANVNGYYNSFYGAGAGEFNTSGRDNSFFGLSAGRANVTGIGNAFFGKQAGFNNTSGSVNAFFGTESGLGNTEGIGNAFVGSAAGANNSVGSNNSFFGYRAGVSNVAGSNLTTIGADANVGADNLSFATAVGARAVVSTSNTVVLGRSVDTVQVPGVLNVASQYNIGGQRVLSAPGFGNLYAGKGAGGASPVGEHNSFFGERAGQANVTNFNSFFGAFAGLQNTFGFNNAFFGANAGFSNTGGTENVFVGAGAGGNNASGPGNTFVGAQTGFNVVNNTGEYNTLVGFRSQIIGQLTNAAAVGAHARVTQSNSLVLGSIGGVNGAASSTNVGIGTTAPRARLHVANGKLYVEASGQGVVLKSPGGACFELTVTDAGALVAAPVSCP